MIILVEYHVFKSDHFAKNSLLNLWWRKLPWLWEIALVALNFEAWSSAHDGVVDFQVDVFTFSPNFLCRGRRAEVFRWIVKEGLTHLMSGVFLLNNVLIVLKTCTIRPHSYILQLLALLNLSFLYIQINLRLVSLFLKREIVLQWTFSGLKCILFPVRRHKENFFPLMGNTWCIELGKKHSNVWIQ